MSLSLGINIKEMRKSKGLTQEELADQLGVTPQAVSRWESQVGMPDISFVVPLAQILDVSTDALFGFGEETLDESYLRVVRKKITEMDADRGRAEMLLSRCEYLREEADKNPTSHEIICMYIEEIADLSRYVDFEGFLNETPEKWNAIRKDGIRKGVMVIRYCSNRELVERAHYALAWIYIHSKEYDEARDHIHALPSVSSNRLQESILAQLANFESGFEEQTKVIKKNLNNLTRALFKEFAYDMEDYMWNSSIEKTESFAHWGLGIMTAVTEKKEMLPFTQGFMSKCNLFLVGAYLRANKVQDAVSLYAKMGDNMRKYQAFCESMLGREDISQQYDGQVIESMRGYTSEYMNKKDIAMKQQLKTWSDKKVFDQFIKQL